MAAYHMNTSVWTEAGGKILKESLKQEARILHQMHQPPSLLADWMKAREKLRQRLLAAAGTFPAPPELDVQEHGTIMLDGYRIIKLSYQSRPDLRVTANLFIPDGKGKFPAILNLHGHYQQGKIASQVAARGHLLAQEGFVVLSVDAIGAGERATVHGKFEHHGNNGVPFISFGETLLGIQVYDNMRAIDLLQSLNYVDGNRIGATGASGGGNQTMWISALDPRVKASVPVVSVGTFEGYITEGNCWCETLPDGLQISEEWGILGLIAPNPLLILTGQREEIPAFLPEQMLRSHGDARKIYALYNAEEKISYQIIDLPHGYFPEMRRHMLGWFKHWLQNEGNSLPRAISKDPELPEVDLMCFPAGKRPKKLKSLIEYVSLRSKAAKKDFLTQPKLDRKGKITELARILRLKDSPDYVRFSEIVPGEENGMRFAKFAVESEPGVLIPCTIIFPEKKFSSVVIAAHPDGKDVCLKQKESKEILSEGKALCLVDLRNIGETRWEHVDDQKHHFGSRATLWLGRTMIGNWVKDLSAVRACLEKFISPERVELLGFGEIIRASGLKPDEGTGETAIAVLAAAALDKGFAAVTVVDMLSTYVVNSVAPVQRYSIVVPGILQWGDISLIAALSNCPVQIKSLVHPSGRTLSSKEHSDWEKEVKILSSQGFP
jgi:hypothetical protein